MGKATSMTWSPILKRVVSLALLRSDRSGEGSRVQIEWTVEGTREQVGATVVFLPFLDLPRKRS